MHVAQGDRVWVNVAPFIGSMTRNEEAVACDVLATAGQRVQVRTLPPLREFVMWVDSQWVEEDINDSELEMLSMHGA